MLLFPHRSWVHPVKAEPALCEHMNRGPESRIDGWIVVLALPLLASCSNAEEMLWWQMKSSGQEYRAVTDLVGEEQGKNLVLPDSLAILSDSAIVYVERIESTLFSLAGIEDQSVQHTLDVDARVYYDLEVASALLIGDDETRP